MVTCRECIHCRACHEMYLMAVSQEDDFYERNDAETCEDFLNKADVVEVKHSRWENISGFDVCNICGTSPAYCEPKPNNPKGYPTYCHNCGAKMDGQRK